MVRVLRWCGAVLAVGVLAGAAAPKADKSKGKHTDRLARESSPHLLQHAHNPVDWYPWGPEAFARAKKEKKLVFLAIGYSSCHWCHVMEAVDQRRRPPASHPGQSSVASLGVSTTCPPTS
jgi:hypothetical protein